ncbi:hypothetical protein HIM_04247 [Hirsutella minnesotensis 3608]|uniref:Ketoreductase (KR) domain-containing protein n=1 Tax=Hirsutella minnesotensis 3608 TaxID=1043627 RepID=A0A0F7ZVF4_9HYPO|nr:hypothetical protein HIM_04247 [Hirsutella minnesotensis 3608]
MAVSPVHMLKFSLWNPYSLSLDPDGPFPALYRLLTTPSPSIWSLDLGGFSGLCIFISGANSGCGAELARALSRVDCHLILATRNESRGQRVRQDLYRESKGVKAVVSVLELDMTSSKSVATLPSRLNKLSSHLDVVVLNAGTYQTEFRVCPETGWEETVQVNVVATTALTLMLHPFLCRAEAGRLLIVSSEAHAWASPQESSARNLLARLNQPAPYLCYQKYHISKLLLVLWAREISQQHMWRRVSVATVSPGFSRTALFRSFNSSPIARAVERLVCRESDQGAAQYVLALQGMAAGHGNGQFWSDGAWRESSAAASCERGREIQSTLYADVLAILRDASVLDEAWPQ